VRLEVALGILATTADTAGAAGGNETDLLTSRSIAAHGRGVTNVLMVTTTVRVLNGVHADTLDVRPAVTLGLVLPVRAASLEHRLVDTATASDNTDHRTGIRLDELLRTGGEAKASLAGLGVVSDDSGIVARSTGVLTTVARASLGVADDGTLGKSTDGQDIADLQLGLLAAVHELTSVHALDADEVVGGLAVLVGVAEDDTSERSTPPRVVDDLLHETLDVAVTLTIVKSAVLSSALAVEGVGLEDATSTLTLSSTGFSLFETIL